MQLGRELGDRRRRPPKTAEDEEAARHIFSSTDETNADHLTRGRRTVGEDGDGVPTASGKEEDGGDWRRRHICSR